MRGERNLALGKGFPLSSLLGVNCLLTGSATIGTTVDSFLEVGEVNGDLGERNDPFDELDCRRDADRADPRRTGELNSVLSFIDCAPGDEMISS